MLIGRGTKTVLHHGFISSASLGKKAPFLPVFRPVEKSYFHSVSHSMEAMSRKKIPIYISKEKNIVWAPCAHPCDDLDNCDDCPQGLHTVDDCDPIAQDCLHWVAGDPTAGRARSYLNGSSLAIISAGPGSIFTTCYFENEWCLVICVAPCWFWTLVQLTSENNDISKSRVRLSNFTFSKIWGTWYNCSV